MTEVQPKRSLHRPPSKSLKRNLDDYKLGINNIVYQVSIAKDGAAWCALLGPDLQKGICGFGKTVAEALHDLANEIDAHSVFA